MMKLLSLAATALCLGGSGLARAAERTVILTVEKMICVSCPYIVRGSLAAIPGVKDVRVSFEEKTATVVFDDAITDTAALTAATTNAGYPSKIEN